MKKDECVFEETIRNMRDDLKEVRHDVKQLLDFKSQSLGEERIKKTINGMLVIFISGIVSLVVNFLSKRV